MQSGPLRLVLILVVLCAADVEEDSLDDVTQLSSETSLRDIAQHSRDESDQDSDQAQVVQIATCVKDTGRACKGANEASVVDHVAQCQGGTHNPFLGGYRSATQVNIKKHDAVCSADLPGGSPSGGTCVCGDGYCADADMLCHSGTYQVIGETFTISSKLFPEEKLYMTSDGKLVSGFPPDPRAAQFRVAVTGSGVKMLWTDLYSDAVLQEYERCITTTDAYGLSHSKCDDMVGNLKNPRASEMGWKMELWVPKHMKPHKAHEYFRPQEHIQIRAQASLKMLYINPTSREGMTCEARGGNCPGDAGAFIFDPPLIGRMDLTLDEAPGLFPPGLATYGITVSLALILLCCGCCVFGMDPKQTKFFASCLLTPMKSCASCLGFKGKR